MPTRDIIVIGASAGGVETLASLVQDLPANLAAAIFVVVHFPAYATSVLPEILSRAGQLPALHPEDDTEIQNGCIYVAPPGYHLILQPSRIRLSSGARENGHRPAIDPLFRTAAKTYRQQVIGVILSGLLDDGSAGLKVVKQCGGLAIVQDPQDAMFNGMVKSAIAHVAVDYILPVAEIAAQLVLRSQDIVERGVLPMTDELEEAKVVREDKAALERGEHSGAPSMLTCPDCGGVLWELGNGDLLRYHCHVGHVYSAESLVAEQSDAVEAALWSAMRALEEKAALARRMAEQAREQGRSLSEVRFLEQANQTSEQAKIIRHLIYHEERKHEEGMHETEKLQSGNNPDLASRLSDNG